MTPNVVGRYLALGLAMDRHVSGLVDSYYGPKPIAARVAAAPITPPEHLVAEARALLAAIDAGEPLGDPDEGPVPDHLRLEAVPDAGRDGTRRHYLRGRPYRGGTRDRFQITSGSKLCPMRAGTGLGATTCVRRRSASSLPCASSPANRSPTPTKSRPVTACAHADSSKTSSRRHTAASTRWCRATDRSWIATWPGASRWRCPSTAWSRRLPRSLRSSGSGPGSCSVYQTASASTSSWSPASRGEASTTPRAGRGRGDRSIPA